VDDSKEKCEEDEKIPKNDSSSGTSIEGKDDGSRTVSKEEQKLLHELRKIPDSDVEKCFEMDKDIFYVRLDEAVEEKKTFSDIFKKSMPNIKNGKIKSLLIRDLNTSPFRVKYCRNGSNIDWNTITDSFRSAKLKVMETACIARYHNT
jgi:hypothetical protein